MVINMKVNGLMIKRMGEDVTLILLQEKNMMVYGQMERNMDRVYICMLQEISILENGEMEKRMVKGDLNM